MKQLETYVNNDTERLILSKCKDEIMDLLKLRNNKWIPVKTIDSTPTITKADQNFSQPHVEKPSFR